MKLLKTDKTHLSIDDINKYIDDYKTTVDEFNKLWRYYLADNPTIMDKKITDPNNPDYRIPLGHGRVIVTTFVGYGYRPRYTTYKAVQEKDASLENDFDEDNVQTTMSKQEKYVDELQKTFNLNKEHIKTPRAARNMAIFGVAYELLYIDGIIGKEKALPVKAEPKFFPVDPREMIVIYDYSSEPKKKMAIRFYRITDDHYKVEVYYEATIETYDRERNKESNQWILTKDGEDYNNYFGKVSVAAYYFGDEMLGVIKPVLPLLDAIDVLYSDSMNEFSRFAYAYMVMKKYGILDAAKVKTPGIIAETLAALKMKRIFENLPADADIRFLTKDIPTEFIKFMDDKLREQIHVQSHVPDFDKMIGTLSTAAVERMLFNFENVVSSAEADFDVGLLERIELITIIYAKTRRPVGTEDDYMISHKRNLPANLKEFADTAMVMKNAGFSAYLIADIMPDDIIPDIQVELARQQKETEDMLPDVENNPGNGLEEENESIDEENEEEDE